MTTYGLTDAGFVVKPLSVILEEMFTAIEAVNGPVDQSSDSVWTRTLGALAERESTQWQQQAAIYNGTSPQTSSGAQLDGVAEVGGITREAESKSTVVVGLTGPLATVVPAATQFSSSVTGEVVVTDGSVTVAANNLVHAEIAAGTPQNTVKYTVTINGTNCDFTSDGTATAAEISLGIANAVNTAALGMSATDNGDGTVTLEADDGETGYSVAVVDDGLNLISFTEYTTPSPCTAQNYGVVLVNTGMIDTIVTPVAGLASVYNYGDGDVGRETEEDAELRVRLRSVRKGAGSVDAIRSRMIDEVDGVSTCLVVENDTDSAIGPQPAHSIHVIVQGGSDQDVVDKIWALKSAGIATYGTSSGTAIDGAGNSHTVYFSRPTTVYGWVRVRYTAYAEETLPTNADDAIADAIKAYGDTFAVGEDMLWQRFLTPVLTTVDGVASAVIELDHTATSGGPPSYVTDTNVAVADSELVVFDLTRIDVAEA
jgi:uncharacterized phage protein gp47/JayE